MKASRKINYRNLKKVYIYIVAVLLLGTVFFTHKSQKKYKQKTIELNILKNDLVEMNYYINNTISTTSRDEGKVVHSKVFLQKNEFNFDNYTKTIDSLPLLVVSVKASECLECVESLLKLIENTIPKYLERRVVILTNYNKPIYAKSFVETDLHSILPFRNIIAEDLWLKSDELNKPIIFIVDNEHKIRQVFAHIKNENLRTEIYIKAMIKKYFK